MHLVDYSGHPEADRVLVLMGSGGQTAAETVAALTHTASGSGWCRCGCTDHFRCRRSLAHCPDRPHNRVLDRTKEPGSLGEPLYLDVVAALAEAYAAVKIPDAEGLGGRYGLSSKEFTPAMVAGVFAGLAGERPRAASPSASTTTSAAPASAMTRFEIESADTVRAVFFGLGSDGTVGANKNTIKILGDEEESTLRATSSTTQKVRLTDRLASAVRAQSVRPPT